uniref:Ig-like domain-containing protein n=1 Tax=Sander lucioperca TaxID=283035 RepID=A0A8C9Z428_SANLU
MVFSDIKQQVIQPTGDVITTEGETVTLDCTFETTASYSYLLWYKQEVNGFPKFMLQIYSGAKDAENFQKERIYATLKDKSFPLKIQKLQLSDSAVYYSLCVFSAVSLHSIRYVRLCSINKFYSKTI